MADQDALRIAARRTWTFFERFVTAQDNMLPPDNFKRSGGGIAHRTSPTNIGLYLISVIAARDFGWIGTAETLEKRLEQTVITLQKLERFHGHFMNWYDTQSLRSLDPRYISQRR